MSGGAPDQHGCIGASSGNHMCGPVTVSRLKCIRCHALGVRGTAGVKLRGWGHSGVELYSKSGEHCVLRGWRYYGGAGHYGETARVKISTLHCVGGRTAGILQDAGHCWDGGNIHCTKYSTNPIELSVAGFSLR